MTFYKAGEIELSKEVQVRMDSQGMVMLKMDGNSIDKLTVSDPSRKLGRMLITVSGSYNSSGENFKSYPDAEGNQTLIMIDLPQDEYAGKSVTVSL